VSYAESGQVFGKRNYDIIITREKPVLSGKIQVWGAINKNEIKFFQVLFGLKNFVNQKRHCDSFQVLWQRGITLTIFIDMIKRLYEPTPCCT